MEIRDLDGLRSPELAVWAQRRRYEGLQGRLNRVFPSTNSITSLDGGRAGRQIVRVRHFPRDSLSFGEAKKVFFLHRREAFHRRSIGYSEFEVVVASSQRRSEFLCAEACHTPIEDAIFWRASPWKHALGKYGILPPSKYSLDYGNTQLTNQIESLAVTSYLFRDNYS